MVGWVPVVIEFSGTPLIRSNKGEVSWQKPPKTNYLNFWLLMNKNLKIYLGHSPWILRGKGKQKFWVKLENYFKSSVWVSVGCRNRE